MNESKVLEKEDDELIPTRSELLEKYLEKPVTEFKQYDYFTNGCPDYTFCPDRDGACIVSGDTYELMYGANIRVLIRPDESKRNAIKALLKLAEWINYDDKFENEIDEDKPF